jgi:hypothetical protein
MPKPELSDHSGATQPEPSDVTEKTNDVQSVEDIEGSNGEQEFDLSQFRDEFEELLGEQPNLNIAQPDPQVEAYRRLQSENDRLKAEMTKLAQKVDSQVDYLSRVNSHQDNDELGDILGYQKSQPENSEFKELKSFVMQINNRLQEKDQQDVMRSIEQSKITALGEVLQSSEVLKARDDLSSLIAAIVKSAPGQIDPNTLKSDVKEVLKLSDHRTAQMLANIDKYKADFPKVYAVVNKMMNLQKPNKTPSPTAPTTMPVDKNINTEPYKKRSLRDIGDDITTRLTNQIVSQLNAGGGRR